MSKPIRDIVIATADGRRANVHAVFDTGSFYSIIRQDKLPLGSKFEKLAKKEVFGTAKRGAKIAMIGITHLKVNIEGHWINGETYIAPQLGSEMLIGAGLMQMWDISIRNKNGRTVINVGRDMDDPDIQTIL
ncbi:MAG: hypothetical protein HY747_12565 [Elusimicrobia bacterium]|nr:hypothetical protein [Elusimicrobiota bacterium]